MKTTPLRHKAIKVTLAAAATLTLCCTLTGCLVVGYSTGAGWWVWPGSLALTLILLALMLLFSRR